MVRTNNESNIIDASPAMRELAERITNAVLAILRDADGLQRLPGELSRTLRELSVEELEPGRRMAFLSEGGDDLPEIGDDLSLAFARQTPERPLTMALGAPLPALGITPASERARLWSRHLQGDRLCARAGVDTWIARDRARGRPVLVDVLPPALPAEHRATLEAASQLAAAAHANIAPLICWGDEDGVCHLVWEAVAGETLETLFARGHRFSPAEALRLAIQAAEALACAHHATGRAHGDLHAKRLTVAYPCNGEAGRETERLVVGGLLLPAPNWADDQDANGLAPVYVAPERFTVSEPTLAGDIYALGALLSHLLTGRAPRGDVAAAQRNHAHAVLADPEAELIELPQDVRTLVATAMALQPSARFLSYRGFVVACEKAIRALKQGGDRETVRILRRPMVKRATVSELLGKTTLVETAPAGTGVGVIAPELAGLPEAPAKPSEDLAAVSTRIARKHAESQTAAPAPRPRFETSVALVKRPLPRNPRARTTKIALIDVPLCEAFRVRAITTRIASKHRLLGSAAPKLNETSGRLRALRRTMLNRPGRKAAGPSPAAACAAMTPIGSAVSAEKAWLLTSYAAVGIVLWVGLSKLVLALLVALGA